MNPVAPVNRLLLGLLSLYRRSLAIMLCVMFLEVLTSLAAPWPLKLVLDDALGAHHLPRALEWAHGLGIGRHMLGLALFAGIATLAIAVVAGIAGYIDSYCTASIGQRIANDLRVRLYEHMHCLSLAFHDHARSASLMSTITTDVATVQSFTSSSTLGILVDFVTIVFMLGLMAWLDWAFTLIAMATMPFLVLLVLLVLRVKRAMKAMTREQRARRSGVVAVVQEGLGSVRAVEAFGRQDLETTRMRAASQAGADAARRIKSMLPPVVAAVVALCMGIILWKGTALIMEGRMTIGALTVYLAYLAKFFKPVKDLAGMAGTLGADARCARFEQQETVLLRGTIAENIAYGRPGATAAQIVGATRLAQCRRVHPPHVARL